MSTTKVVEVQVSEQDATSYMQTLSQGRLPEFDTAGPVQYHSKVLACVDRMERRFRVERTYP